MKTFLMTFNDRQTDISLNKLITTCNNFQCS